MMELSRKANDQNYTILVICSNALPTIFGIITRLFGGACPAGRALLPSCASAAGRDGSVVVELLRHVMRRSPAGGWRDVRDAVMARGPVGAPCEVANSLGKAKKCTPKTKNRLFILPIHFCFLLLRCPIGGICCCSSVVEHFLGKEEVTSSSLVNSSREE